MTTKISKVMEELRSEEAVEQFARAKAEREVSALPSQIREKFFQEYAEAFRTYAHKINGSGAATISQMLFVNADEKLSKLK